VALVQLADEVELLALRVLRGEFALEVGDDLVRRSTGAEGGVGALVEGREEGRSAGVGAAAEGDEAREILAFGTQTVEDPGAEGRLGEDRRAGVHQLGGRAVGRDTLVQRADDAHVVGHALELREDLGDLEAGLTGLLELERSREEDAVHAGGRHVGELLHLRLRIEGVEVRGSAAREDVDDVLRLGGERSLARLEVGHHFGLGVADEVVGDHGAESERAHAEAGLAQELAARVRGGDVISAPWSPTTSSATPRPK